MAILDRKIPPVAQPVAQVKMADAHHVALSDTLEMYYYPSFQQDVIGLQLVFPAGKAFVKDYRMPSFCSKMITEGTKSKSSKEISEYIANYGAHLEINAGNTNFFIELYVLKKYLAPMLELVKELITDAVFPQNELDSLLVRSIQKYKVQIERNNFLATKMFREGVFGNTHPFGYSPNEEEISSIKKVDLEEFYADNIKNSGFIIFAAGHVEDQEISLLKESLSGLCPRKPLFNVAQIPNPINTAQDTYIQKEKAVQTSVRMGGLTINAKHPDYTGLTLLTDILGGYFGSRLMKNIREEKGLSYGIYSSLSNFGPYGYFIISSELIKDKKDVAKSEIQREMQRLIDEPVGEDELDLIKNYTIGSFLMSISTSFALIEKFKFLYFNNLPFNYYETQLKEISETPAERLMSLADTYFKGPFLTVEVG